MVCGVLSEGEEAIVLNLGPPDGIVPNPFLESPGVLRTDGGIGVEWWGPDGIGKEDGGLGGRCSAGFTNQRI